MLRNFNISHEMDSQWNVSLSKVKPSIEWTTKYCVMKLTSNSNTYHFLELHDSTRFALALMSKAHWIL